MVKIKMFSGVNPAALERESNSWLAMQQYSEIVDVQYRVNSVGCHHYTMCIIYKE